MRLAGDSFCTASAVLSCGAVLVLDRSAQERHWVHPAAAARGAGAARCARHGLPAHAEGGRAGGRAARVGAAGGEEQGKRAAAERLTHAAQT